MPEFVDDVEWYITRLTTSTNLQNPPSASSSPLSPTIELAIQHVKLRHEVQTSGTLYGISIDVPLPCIHPWNREACFECHHLGLSESIASGMFVQSVRSINPVTPKITVLTTIISPTPPPSPLDLVLFPLPISKEWFQKTLQSIATIPVLAHLLVSLLPGLTSTMMMIPLPTWLVCLSLPSQTSDRHHLYVILLWSFRCKWGVMLQPLLFSYTLFFFSSTSHKHYFHIVSNCSFRMPSA